MYARGGQQDYKMAVYYLQLSANQGNDLAHENLALMSERGDGGLCQGLHAAQPGNSEWRGGRGQATGCARQTNGPDRSPRHTSWRGGGNRKANEQRPRHTRNHVHRIATVSNIWGIAEVAEVLKRTGLCTKQDLYDIITEFRRKNPRASIPKTRLPRAVPAHRN